MTEDLDHRSGKPALRKDRRSLHEQHDGTVGDVLVDTLLNRVVHFPDPRAFGGEFPVTKMRRSVLGRSGLQSERMELVTHPAAQRLVHHLMLLHARLAAE